MSGPSVLGMLGLPIQYTGGVRAGVTKANIWHSYPKGSMKKKSELVLEKRTFTKPVLKCI